MMANCFGPPFDNNSRVCAGGVWTAHGATCVTQCRAGYTPSVASLFCSDGDFYPPTFSCRAPGCTAPAVRHSLSTSCQEGAHLPSGGTCTPNCAVGSEASVPALTCSAGRLTPLTFSCSEPRCAAPTVQFAKTPSCREGATIKSGGVCTLLCQSGYVSSVELLSCLVGDFSPSNFTCSPHNALEQLVRRGGGNICCVLRNEVVIVAVVVGFVLSSSVSTLLSCFGFDVWLSVSSIAPTRPDYAGAARPCVSRLHEKTSSF